MYKLKPEWQDLTKITETVADALSTGAGLEVVWSSPQPGEPLEMWVEVRLEDGRHVLLQGRFQEPAEDSATPTHSSMDNYSLPTMSGVVDAEQTHLTDAMFRLMWSNPASPLPRSAPKAQRIKAMQEEARVHRAMLKQVYEERKAQAPAWRQAAVDDAYQVLLTHYFDLLDADLAKGVIK